MAIPDLQEALDLIEDGRAEEALTPLTAWAQQMPAHAAVHVVLAQAYEAMEQWDDARAAWQRAHFLMPNSPAAAEGLERIHAATTEAVAAGEDRLIMDLDLQAELEATLEALFNPFTLPQQSEAALKEEPMTEETAVLEQVEAALAAALADAAEEAVAQEAEAPEAIEPTETPAAPETEALPEEAEAAEAMTEEPHDTDATSIYEEIEQLIEEKEVEKHAPVEQQQADQHDLEEGVEESQEAVDALEAMGEETAEEEAVGLETWQDFEAEPEDAPPSDDATLDDLDRLISELEAARIVPQPDLEDVPPPELDDEIDDMVSETLARIYASQKKYDEAARTYEQLAHQQPQEATKFLQLAAEMRGLAGGPDDQE